MGAAFAAMGVKFGYISSETIGTKGYTWLAFGLGFGSAGFYAYSRGANFIAFNAQLGLSVGTQRQIYSDEQAVKFLDSQTKNKI